MIIQADQWIIRVDKMPNGAKRYASWKGKKEVEVPDLVINNGYCASTNVRNTENSSLFGAKVETVEKYIFQNGDYFYKVSWIFEGGYEYSRIDSAKTIVKHNDIVLMTL